MAYGNDDISLFVSCLDILVSLDNLLQGIASINDRFYLPCLDQSIEKINSLVFSLDGLNPVAAIPTFFPPLMDVHNT